MITKEQVMSLLSAKNFGEEIEYYLDNVIESFAQHYAIKYNSLNIDDIGEEFVEFFWGTRWECRRCSVCGHIFREGYVEGMGFAYYCSDECLHTKFTDEEWAQECEDDDQSYYTEFY